MRDELRRTIAKTISWRVVTTITTVALVFVFTKELKIALGIGAVDMIVNMISYFIHERIWDKVDWGKHKQAGT